MSEPPPLAGRVALIAGPGGHWGRAIAVALAEAGADVALASVTGETAEQFAINSVANELWALDRWHVTLTMDFDQPATIAVACAQALHELGRLDFVVNAALDTATQEKPFLETPDVAWRQALLARLGGAVALSRAAAEAMLERSGGGLLNLVSDTSRGRAGGVLRATAEAGITALTRSLALEWVGRLAVNAAVVRKETPPESVTSLAVLLAGAGPTLTGQVFEL